jgi:hypothetical protein
MDMNNTWEATKLLTGIVCRRSFLLPVLEVLVCALGIGAVSVVLAYGAIMAGVWK